MKKWPRQDPRNPNFQSCGRKVRYGTEDIAVSVAATRFKRGAGIMRPYSCIHCGGWHLTSKPVAALTQPKSSA